MSQQLISRSPDLKRLQDEGFHIEVQSGYLLLKDVPYVDHSREIRRGTLVSTLTLAGDETATPGDHVAMFIGSYPCNERGEELDQIRNAGRQELSDGLVVDHTFSSKLVGGRPYSDYYEKMTAYAAILASRAQTIDPDVTPRTNPVVVDNEDDSPFVYMETASSRAGITRATYKLRISRVAIVGLGGSGSYVLDLIAKTPVQEIHLFDADEFLSHNAFRAPGAATLDELRSRPKKVAYLKNRYSAMRRGIITHECFIDHNNVSELAGMDFIFLCMQAGETKRAVVEGLEGTERAFIDVGMGMHIVDNALGGTVRVTTSLPNKRETFRRRTPLDALTDDDHYNRNIQIADLNALNAALAVVKWKKLFGFYMDLGEELSSTLAVDTSALINDNDDA